MAGADFWPQPEAAPSDEEEPYNDEDSICSWLSEAESVPHNWRGWSGDGRRAAPTFRLDSLSDLAAKSVAKHFTLDAVEERLEATGMGFTGLHPEAFQMKMIRYCFPRSDSDIRLYSVLASGNSEEFLKGESLFRAKAVRNLLQIGFHLSATVRVGGRGEGAEETSVAITVDRCHITSCTCSCASEASWCAHTVAVCLHRIHWAGDVAFRAPLSESLATLARVSADDEREDLRRAVRRLQKFAQHLIQQLPRQVLPVAQALLDELKEPDSAKSRENGAPDPTSGGGKDEAAAWRIDTDRLNEKVGRMLGKLCTPAPTVFADVNYLGSSLPPATAEWQSLLKPLRGKDPEGLWNLLGIVSELLRRRDDNGPDLLHIITKQLLEAPQLLLWWVGTKLAQSGRWLPSGSGKAGLATSAQFSAASVADQVVALWRLVALNPKLSPEVRAGLGRRLTDFHTRVVASVHGILNDEARDKSLSLGRLSLDSARFDLDSFPGFRAAVVACRSDWADAPIKGLTYAAPPLVSLCELEVEGLELGSPRPRSSASPSLPVLRPQPPRHIVPSNRPRAQEPAVDEIEALYRVQAQPDVDDSEELDSPSEPEPLALVESELGRLGPIPEGRERRFSRCEALFAHGHTEEAWKLAVEMAEDLLAHPPDLMAALPPPIKVPPSVTPAKVGAGGGKKKRRATEERMPHPLAVAISAEASRTLEKAAFLCDVLLRGPKRHGLAFRVGLLGLETPRQAAATKFLEVKMNQQEAELAGQLRGMALGAAELEMVRERARRLRLGPKAPVLPFALAHFVADTLAGNGGADEELGFEAALATLGLRSSVSEAEHPLLSEGIRRQRGDLAIALFVRYKEDGRRLQQILSTLLDPEMHQMIPIRKSSEPSRRPEAAAAIARSYSGISELSAAGLDDELMAQIEAEAGEPGAPDEADVDDASDSGSSGDPRRKASSPPRLALLRRRAEPPTAPSLPNMASKAQSHLMTELAKRLLIEAGGSHSSAIFNAAQNLPNPAHADAGSRPHRALHLCAFQIGLYALGLDNKVSHNWLTRTYSNQVSWISCQAQEIGRTAINILIQCWENHLTPTEVAMIADKASLAAAGEMASAAAELALSVLPHAHALMVQDTKRALAQCKDQGMLEAACTAVEKAAKDCGVYPEVLFQVARHWASLAADDDSDDARAAQLAAHHHHQLAAVMQQQQQHQLQLQAAAAVAAYHGHGGGFQNPQQAAIYQQLALMAGNYGYAPTSQASGFSGYPQMLRPQQNQQLLQYQQQHMFNQHGPRGLHVSQSAPSLLPQSGRHSSGHNHGHLFPNPLVPSVQELESESLGPSQLHKAYRVGMLAMETMSRRIQDERAYTKYCQNPAYGDDVNFLLGISKRLGLAHAQRFFVAAGQSIVSPFLLWELGVDAARLLSPAPPPPPLLHHHLAHPTVHYLVDRSIQMFYEAAHQKLSHPRFAPSDVEEVLTLVKEAQRNFMQVPGGQGKFQDFLESVRKQKACKKDLWNKITAALSTSH